jgi:DNA helicase HerA-like ATPase
MSDKIINFYEKLNIKGSKLPKNWNKHHIMHNSMILALGGTGTGKTNALLNYIKRSSGEFVDIIIFSASTTDEPLYNLLEENGVTLYNDIDELPELSEFEDDKDQKKLIIFDDFINIDKKKLKKINRYLISGRKFGFSVFLMAQNYSSVDKQIVRQIQYFIIFKINDNISLNNIIRNHNIADIDPIVIKSACNLCTQTPPDFFMIDLKTINKKERFRKNFSEFLDLENLP